MTTTAPDVWIEPLSAADIPGCVALERLLFAGDSPWSGAAFAQELAGRDTRYFAARDRDYPLLGYAGIALLGPVDSRDSEIRTIAVDPGRRRSGIGTRLFEALLAEAEEHGGPVFLEVRVDNEPAIAMYRKYGFDVLGVRKRYYQPSGADAYSMCRSAGADPDGRSVR